MLSRSPQSAVTSSFFSRSDRSHGLLILERLKYLKSEARLESVVSRESSFMFNNLILLASCFGGSVGHALPVNFRSRDWREDQRRCAILHRINIPIGLGLLFLTALARSSPGAELGRKPEALVFRPSVAGIALMAVLAVLRNLPAPLRAGFPSACACSLQPRSSRVLERRLGHPRQERIGLIPAAVELTHRNTAAMADTWCTWASLHVHRLHRCRF